MVLATTKVKRRTQAERREEAERRIVQSAIKLVSERGYDGFTLADVGEAAGYSRGLPAHYFGRKEDLLSLVAEHTVEGYRTAIANLPQTERGLPRLVSLIRKYTAPGDSQATRSLSLLIAESLVRPDLKKTIKKLNDRGLETLEVELRLGIEAGNIRPDIDVKAQASMIYSFLRGQMSFQVLDSKFDWRAVGEEFLATLQARLSVSRKRAPTRA